MKQLWMLSAMMFVPSGVSALQVSVEVAEVATTRGSSATPFGTIGDLLALPSGRVVVTDDVVRAIWVWQPSSGEVTRLARVGRGPGEVQTPVQIARRRDGGIGVYDPGLSRVLLFDAQLEFERTILISGLVSNPKDFLFLRDGSFVISGGRLSDPAHLQRYGPEGARLGQWGEPGPMLEEPHTRIQMAGGALRDIGEGRWLFGSAMPYRVTLFSSADFSRPTLWFEDLSLVPEATEESLTSPLEGGATAFLWWFDRITGLFPLPDEGVLTVVSRFYSRDSVWSIHDRAGDLVGRVVVDRSYEVYDRVDDNHYVGTFRDPDTDERVAVLLQVLVRR